MMGIPEMNEQKNTIAIELIIGMLVYGIAVQIILFFLPDRLFNSIGLWLGILIGVGMALHMKHSIENALELGESGAQKHLLKHYGLRIIAVGAVFGIAYYFKLGNMLTMFIGVMGLKAAAYAQPHVHRLFDR